MRRRLNREKALLAFAVLLLSWALVKWGVFLGTRPERLGAAVAPRVTIHTRDADFASQFPAPPLSRYALGDDPFRLGQYMRRSPLPDRKVDDRLIVDKAENTRKDDRGTQSREGNRAEQGGTNRVVKTEVVVEPIEEGVIVDPIDPVDVPLRLVGTVKTGRYDPARRALIQDKGTGTVRDARVGDLLPGDYKLGSIQDDSVTVIDTRGRFHVLGGRHREHYD